MGHLAPLTDTRLRVLVRIVLPVPIRLGRPPAKGAERAAVVGHQLRVERFEGGEDGGSG